MLGSESVDSVPVSVVARARPTAGDGSGVKVCHCCVVDAAHRRAGPEMWALPAPVSICPEEHARDGVKGREPEDYACLYTGPLDEGRIRPDSTLWHKDEIDNNRSDS